MRFLFSLPLLFRAELRRELRLWFSYRQQAISSLALWCVAFPLMMVTLDSVAGGYGETERQASLLGFLVWRLCAGLLAVPAEIAVVEARQGTLEQLLLTPCAVAPLVHRPSDAAATRQAVETGCWHWRWCCSWFADSFGVVDLAAHAVRGGGRGVALGGLALVHKRVESVVGVFTLLVVLFSGALVPLNALGSWFTTLKLLVGARPLMISISVHAAEIPAVMSVVISVQVAVSPKPREVIS
jgi:hypothetical protein